MIYFDCVMNWAMGRLSFRQMVAVMRAAAALKRLAKTGEVKNAD